MKTNIADTKVGDTIIADCGYLGNEDWQSVVVVSIGEVDNLWVKGKTVPHVVVRMASGETFSLHPRLFS